MNTKLQKKFIEDRQLRGYAERTQTSYARAVRQLENYWHVPEEEIEEQQVRDDFLYCNNEAGWSAATMRIAYSGTAFFVHARPLSKIYRAKFIALLKKEGLEVPPCVWNPDWVVDCRSFGNGKKALKYLAQYVFRVAIAPSRILTVADGKVTFKYQRSGEKKWRKCELKIFEFLRRYG